MQKNSEKNTHKIGILTFHFAHNCGAVLQAYALMKTVEKYAPCFIVDYQPEYHASWDNYRYKYEYPPTALKRIWTNNRNKLKALASMIVHFPAIMKDSTYRKDKKRTEAFEKFIQKNLHCTSRCRSLSEVEAVTGDFCALITGSDQVWNPGIAGENFDNTYFLMVNHQLKRYSYAASAGNGWGEENIDLIVSKLKGFDGVSVREEDLKNVLESRGIPSRMDIDPSLLLDQSEYYPLEEAVDTPEHYVFIYSFQITDELVQSIQTIKERLNCEFISSPFGGKLSEKVGFAIREMEPLGPAAFLYLMHHADYVVTSTFHGLAFATIYQKPFVCLPPEHGISRIDNFLSLFGLQSHFWQGENCLRFDADYSHYLSIVGRLRSSAEGYINEICTQ